MDAEGVLEKDRKKLQRWEKRMVCLFRNPFSLKKGGVFFAYLVYESGVVDVWGMVVEGSGDSDC